MSKSKIIAALVSVMVLLSLIYFWPSLRILLSDSAYYTEKDERQYNLLTDDIIKYCPRISADYEFSYGAAEGPGKEVSAITFKNSTDMDTIKNYLSLMGFSLDYSDFSGEYWKSANSDKIVHIGIIENPKTTVVEVLK
ncbi:hypothetical protein B4923_09120 [Brenneria roseae subsp. americana]|uniref:Uncharacterized protein n=1 Tax=Brenneria roseae subsp. americana TaxID=1508507 RepID=A0A2U1TTH6_9GAMM|nr:hypothetical protein [Brenneria roseae]PWC12689.1 hypothetical protein B4923_09120 [Brenneria roseae subsp. americana]